MKTLKTAAYLATLSIMICSCSATSPPVPEITLSPEENAKLFADQADRLAAMLPKLREKKRGKDFLISETGISKLLDAAALGAVGETEAQVRHFVGDQQMPLGNDSVYKNANLLYFANPKTIHKDYRKALSDFIVEPSIKAINTKVDKLTDGKIPDAMKNVPPTARVVLSNVMTFNAKWFSPFNENATKDKAFTALCKGKTTVGEVATMHDTLDAAYLEDGEMRVVSVSFVDGYRLLIAMNADSNASPAKAAEWLFANQGNHINGLLRTPAQEVKLALPKLDLSSEHDLIPIMKQLGVTAMFSPTAADFSKMSDEKLTVGLFEQQIKLKADEKGAKAAAVTNMAMIPIAMPPGEQKEPVVFNVNHPFAFAIIKANNPQQIVLAGEVSSLGVCDE